MEFDKTSDFFTAFRKDYGFPYFYREEPLNWFRDVGMWGVGIGYVAAVLTVTVLIALLGTRGYSRWRVTLQMIISLGIGLSIIICVTGTYWGIASYETTEGNITKKYSLRVGLNGANITMEVKDYDSDDDGDFSEYHNLKIGWVEVYQAEQEYREALLKGWPIPILKIARYISADMGGMRYMRAFRSSGYAVWVLLWTAFAVWLLSNILIGSNITYSAIFLLGTGMLKVLAVIVYSARQPDNFYIHIDDGNARPLRLMYDWMYWVTLFIGIFTILIAAIMLVLDYLRPADMNKFFGTLSEIHSPYDDELLMNKNKDIKGMIRSFSAKRPHQRGGAIRRDESDVEGINKTANGRGGHVNFSGKHKEGS